MQSNFFQNEITVRSLGENIKKQRIQSELTQAQLAQKAGVSKRTVERVESGESIQLSNFMQILNALEIAQNFALLFPDLELSPYQYMERHNQKKTAERVRSHHTADKMPFKWGDEK